MNTEIEKIKNEFKDAKEFASSIMEGECEYDGSDGARTVLSLCCLAEKLISIIESKKEESTV